MNKKKQQIDRFAPPPLPSRLIVRKELLERFKSIHYKKLCLVAAPAGYSKTTSVSLFAQNENELVFRWLSIQNIDKDAHTFFSRFSACIASKFPLFSAAFQIAYEEITTNVSLKTQEQARHSYETLGAKAGEILVDTLNDELTLVLDDYHIIDDEHFATPFIHGLLHHSPAYFRLILATRVTPSVDLMLFSARQQLLEISSSHLLFSEIEFQSLAELHLKEEILLINSTVVKQLHKLIGGWAAGIVLALEALEGSAIPKINTGESEETIHRYFAEQIFSSFSNLQKSFALATCVLDSFTAIQAESLLVHHLKLDDVNLSQEVEGVMSDLLRRKLISRVSEEDNAYRYHQLLQGFFLHKLSNGDKKQLQEHAAVLLLNSHPEKALDLLIKCENANKLLGCIENLILTKPSFPLTTLLNKCVQLKTEILSESLKRRHALILSILYHQLGNIDQSEKSFLCVTSFHESPQHDFLFFYAWLSFIRNLQMQSRFREAIAESEKLLGEISTETEKFQYQAVKATALAMNASSLARVSITKEKLIQLMLELDVSLKQAHGDQYYLLFEEWIWKDKCALAQMIGYQQTRAVYREREQSLINAPVKSLVNFHRDFAFRLILAGDFNEAQQHIDQCLKLSDKVANAAAYYTATYLRAEYETAKGAFDIAIKCYDEARSYFEIHSPSNALSVTLSEIISCYLFKRQYLVQEHTEFFKYIFGRLHEPTSHQLYQCNIALVFSFLSLNQWYEADAIIDSRINHEAERELFTYLLKVFIAAVANVDESALIQRIITFLEVLQKKQYDEQRSTLRFHWRMVSIVLKSIQGSDKLEDIKKSTHHSLQILFDVVSEQERMLLLNEAESVGSLVGNHQYKYPSEAKIQLSKTVKPLIHLKTLGELRITNSSDPNAVIERHDLTDRMKSVFGILLINIGKPVRISTFIESYWTHSSAENKKQLLKNSLSHLRKLFISKGIVSSEQSFITKVDDGYMLSLGTYGVDYSYDAASFKHIILQAEKAASSGQTAKSMMYYREAIEVYSGDFFGDTTLEEWVLDEQEWFRNAITNALTALANQAFESRDFLNTIAYCEKILDSNPLAEQAYMLLIQSYLHLQRNKEAFQIFERCKKSFRKMLQTFPPYYIEKLIRPIRTVKS